jgi:hypothetical protein
LGLKIENELIKTQPCLFTAQNNKRVSNLQKKFYRTLANLKKHTLKSVLFIQPKFSNE